MNGMWSSGNYLGSGNSEYIAGGARGNLACPTPYYGDGYHCGSHQVYRYVFPPRKYLERKLPPTMAKKRPSTLTDFRTKNNCTQQGIKSCDPDLLSIDQKPNTHDRMEPKMELGDLKGKKICELRETLEINLSFENISVKDMADWIIENPDNNKEIPYEYNPLAERFIIKLMPHAISVPNRPGCPGRGG
ncbi:hypothetical protein HOY80DRAFT_997527 [Tuber brumale]|nr:hypothetical protein HOY80DRAFT_997527 [Tuber brumale]